MGQRTEHIPHTLNFVFIAILTLLLQDKASSKTEVAIVGGALMYKHATNQQSSS
jgi:hypothetical protein